LVGGATYFVLRRKRPLGGREFLVTGRGVPVEGAASTQRGKAGAPREDIVAREPSRATLNDFEVIFVCRSKRSSSMQTPQSNLERITSVLKAWENLRPDKSFGELTLDEYKRIVQPSLDSRARIAQLQALLIAERATRDEADRTSMPATRRVVDSVMGDPAEGLDGGVYEAMGFVRASEIRRGLVRRVGRRKGAR
jgi:hypothetical protein